MESSTLKDKYSKCSGMCVCVCVCVCVYVHSLWSLICLDQLECRGVINIVIFKIFLSYAKFLHRYFRMKHQALLTSRFILFTHQKGAEPRLS